MDVVIEISQSDDNQIHLVLKGLAEGVVHFHDINAFAASIEKCHEFIGNYEEYVRTLIPIPEPFLDAFDDSGNA